MFQEDPPKETNIELSDADESLGYTAAEACMQEFGIKLKEDNGETSSSTSTSTDGDQQQTVRNPVEEESIYSNVDKMESFKRAIGILVAHRIYIFLLSLSVGWLGYAVYSDLIHDLILLNYLASIFPLWLLSHILFRYFMFALRSLVHWGLKHTRESAEADEEAEYGFLPELYNLILFLSRRRRKFLQIVTISLLAVLCRFTFLENSATKAQLLNTQIHVTLLLILIAQFLSGFFAYRFFQKFTGNHHTEKLYRSIFCQVILLTLAGIKGSKVIWFLPYEMNSSSKFDVENKQRLDHAAIEYVLKNKLATALAYHLGMKGDKPKIVKANLLRHIRNRFKTLKLKKKSMSNNVGDFPRRFKHSQSTPRLAKLFQDNFPTDAESQSSVRSESAQPITFPALSDKTPVTDFKIFNAEIKEAMTQIFSKHLNFELAMKFLDEFEQGYVTMEDLKKFIDLVFTERANLKLTLKDSRTVTRQIEMFLFGFLVVLVGFLSLFVWQVDVSQAWLTMSSIIVSFSFIFGNSIRSMFENIVFLYAVHPYDVGDSIRLDGVVYNVRRVLLQTTELDNILGEIRIIQNSRMSKEEPLYNLSRSTGYWVMSYYTVDVTKISEDLIAKIEDELHVYIKENPQAYHDYIRVDYHTFKPPLKVELALGIWLKITMDDFDAWHRAYSKLAFRFMRLLIDNDVSVYSTYVEFSDKNGEIKVT